MGKGYLLDTNAIIYYIDGKIPSHNFDFMTNIIENEPKISVITEIELLGFNIPTAFLDVYTELVDFSEILGLDKAVVKQTIDLRKSKKIKLEILFFVSCRQVSEILGEQHSNLCCKLQQ